jgi:hypothetical protein
VIKRIRLVTRPAATPAEEFALRWPKSVTGTGLAPPDARPLRITASVVLPELSGPGGDSGHGPDGAAIEWFTSEPHLARFDSWLATLPGPAGALASQVVVAREHALRGEPWLARRWRDGGERFKHMALATRAAGLSAGEFSRRWRAHAGTAGPARIPEAVRGRAYVQNHPVPGEWPYDAINEVYFDDLTGLRQRVDWFRANVPAPADGELFGQSWLIAVRETVLDPGPHP